MLSPFQSSQIPPPILSSTQFLDIFKFSKAFRVFKESFIVNSPLEKGVPFASFLSLDLRMYLADLKIEVEDKDFDNNIAVIIKNFPVRKAEMVDLLDSIKLQLPAPGANRTQYAMVGFFRDLAFFEKHLDLKPNVIINQLPYLIPQNRELVRKLLVVEGCTTTAQASKALVDLAKETDTMADMQYSCLHSNSFPSPRPQNSQSNFQSNSNSPHKNNSANLKITPKSTLNLKMENSNSSSNSSSNSNSSPKSEFNTQNKHRRGPLSWDEKQRRKELNHCLYCDSPDHLVDSCPIVRTSDSNGHSLRNRKIPPSIPSSLPSSLSSSPLSLSSSGSATSSASAVPKNPQHVLHNVQIDPEHAERVRVNPQPLLHNPQNDSEHAERVPDSSQQLLYNVQTDSERAESVREPLTTLVPLAYIRLESNGVPFSALLDSGASFSMILESLALQLKWKILCDPVSYSVADGRKGCASSYISVPLQLTPASPIKEIKFWIFPTLAGNNHAIISSSDLAGHSINFLNPPSLSFLGSFEDGSADIDVEPPECFPQELTISAIPETVLPSKLVKLGEMITNDSVKLNKFTELLDSFADVFSPLDEKPSELPVFKVTLKPNAKATVAKVRYFSPDVEQFIHETVEKNLKLGFIYKNLKATFISAVVPVKSASGKLRLAVDYKSLNDSTEKISFPIPSVQEVLSSISNKPFMGKIDLASGYHQVRVDEDSQPHLSFITREGVFTYRRLPFGPTGGPSHFQNAMTEAFSSCKHTVIFFDDICTSFVNFEGFLDAYAEVFSICRKLHLKVNASKCIFGFPKLPMLGRLVSVDSIEVDPVSLEPLNKLRSPANKKELQSFLGLANFFSSFVPHLSQILNPLWILVRKDIPFKWSSLEEQTLRKVVAVILDAKPLAHFVAGSHIILQGDFSQFGIAGVISQEIDGVIRPLMFCGRTLHKHEQNYAVIEGEGLAIVEMFDKARKFLLPSSRITVKSDHSNLQYIWSSLNKRIIRWRIFLMEFRFTVLYVPGEANLLCDALSRLVSDSPDSSSPPPQLNSTNLITQSPEQIDNCEVPSIPSLQFSSELKTLLGDIPTSFDENGIVKLQGKPPLPFIVKIWSLVHVDPLNGHFGRDRTIELALRSISWPGIVSDFNKLTSECPMCQKLRATDPPPHSILSTRAEFPFESIFIDHLGPFKATTKKNVHVLVVIDRFSNFVMLHPVPDLSAETTLKVIWENWICIYGIPKKITSDSATAFNNSWVQNFMTAFKVQHHFSAVLHPEGHGSVERMNYVIAQVIRSHFPKNNQWDESVKPCAFAINAVTSRATGFPPFQIIHGILPNIPLNAALGVNQRIPSKIDNSDSHSYTKSLIGYINYIYAQVRKNSLELFNKVNKELIKKDADHHYEKGDFVIFKIGRSEKLDTEWAGPFVVTDKDPISPNIYKIKSLVNNYERRVDSNRMKLFRTGNLSADELRCAALDPREDFVLSVSNHKLFQNKLSFLCKLTSQEKPMWLDYEDCRFCPAVSDYMVSHNLK